MVTSFSDKDDVIAAMVVVVSTMLTLLSAVVIENEVVDEEELNVSFSSDGNVGKEIDTLEALFEPVDVDSSSSSPKGDIPTTLVPSSLVSMPPVLPMPPPRILRRMTGPRTRMISPIIELTFDSIL